jgi:hypothetical protein
MEKLELAAYLLQNWEVLSLIVTNILALFIKSPLQKGLKK